MRSPRSKTRRSVCSLAEELLGGSSERLQGLLGLTAEELANLRKEARDTNFVMSEETINALADAGLAFAKIKTQINGLINTLIAEFAPALERVADWLEKQVP